MPLSLLILHAPKAAALRQPMGGGHPEEKMGYLAGLFGAQRSLERTGLRVGNSRFSGKITGIPIKQASFGIKIVH